MVQCRCPSCEATMGEFEVACGACGAALTPSGTGLSLHAIEAIASKPDSQWVPGAHIGRYRVKGELGTGAMGSVYRAFDEVLGRDVALKALRSELLADSSARLRFLREARILSLVRHPLVGVIFDAVEVEDVPVLVMELYEGESLATRLTRGPLPRDRAIRVAANVCDALAAVHAAGIIHRDLKPANIVVLPDDTLRVLDFGLSKVILPSGLAEDGIKTTRGQLVGTMAYMAPEQVQGEEAVPQSDLWALGVVLFEMLAGTRPFSSAREILSAAAPLQRLDPHGAPLELLAALLSKEISARPASAREVKRVLEASLLDTAPPSERSLGPADEVGRYKLRRPLAKGERAEVWLAVDPSQHEVVLKLFTGKGPTALEAVERELELLRRVAAPFVARVLDHGVLSEAAGPNSDRASLRRSDSGRRSDQHGRPYLVTEWIEGSTLAEQLRSGPLCSGELSRLAEALLDAVEATHRAGVVHGDLSPANLVLTPLRAAPLCIVDFESARRVGPLGADSATRIVMGTVPYMSPELAEGSAPNELSDLWAVGIILFEAAVGHRPFEVQSTAKLLAALHLQPRPVPSRSRPDLGRAFDAFWFRCSAEDPQDRPQDIKALREELLAALAQTEQTAAGIAAVTTRAPALQPRRWLGPTLLAAAVLAGSAFVIESRSRSPVAAINPARTLSVGSSESAAWTAETSIGSPAITPQTSGVATSAPIVSAATASPLRSVARPTHPHRVQTAAPLTATPSSTPAAKSFEDLLERPD